VRTFLGRTLFAVICVLGLAMHGGTLQAAPQEPAGDSPSSLRRLRKQLEKTPGPGLKLDVDVPVRPTFKSRVDQRAWVLTLEEALHKQFDLNDLQRQSAAWASQCCGFNVGHLLNAVEKALHQRKIRKTREQIARELAEIEAARKKTAATDMK
jgi:hypothetical protein